MIERRNFYRILHIQPDAPAAVIREIYRLLMEAHKNHPGPNTAHRNINLLDIAYKTLQNSQSRAAYDRDLLQRYPIKTLSQGAFGSSVEHINQTPDRRSCHRNRRNYYRVLQVQPDAPDVTITASYRTLKQNQPQDSALLDEAYRILSNPAARKQYDTIFSSYTLRGKKSAATNPDLPIVANAPAAVVSFLETNRITNLSYCFFCNTPYVPQTGYYQHEICLECASPLHALPQSHFESSRRWLERIPVTGEFLFYLFWPSKPAIGIFQDLSPAGVRFATNAMLNPKDIVKIDAPNFQAIAEVTYTQHEKTGLSVGTRFITAIFERRQGSFIIAQA